MPQAWNQALVRIASAKDPNALPTDDRVLFYDDRTITIYDKFAKAQYHFLVLPRIPFKLANGRDKGNPAQAPPALSAANGKLTLGSTSSNVVPASHLRNISALMTSPYVVEVLAAVREASDRVLDHIRDDMQRKHGVTWSIERAFHAVPSMEHLHLHVTSMDLVSDRLKHKKHYLSFVPTVDFAQRLDDVDKMVAEGRQALPKSERAYENLLKDRSPAITRAKGLSSSPISRRTWNRTGAIRCLRRAKLVQKPMRRAPHPRGQQASALKNTPQAVARWNLTNPRAHVGSTQPSQTPTKNLRCR